MTSDGISRSKLKSAYQELSVAASALNQASDQLGNAIRALDESLAKLNVGVSAWVRFSGYTEDDEPWITTEEWVGYDKVGSKWGIAIKVTTSDKRDDSIERNNEWLFNDAPRALRLRTVDHIPDVIRALTKEAQQAATRIKERAVVADELAKALLGTMEENDASGGRQ